MRPVPARLTAAVASAAAVSAVLAAALAAGFPATSYGVTLSAELLGAVAAGLGVVALAQLARLKVRAGPGQATLAWGEAAMVVLCVNLPPALIPLVVLAGVGVSHAVLRVVDARAGRVRSARDLLYSVSALTVAGSLAVVGTVLVQPVHDVPLTPRGIVALCAGALVYCAVAISLVAAHVATTRGGRPAAVAVELLRGKLLMVVGNIAVGLIVVWVCFTDALLLLLLPPLLWLLQQLYASRIGDREERRTWHEFAEATRDLNRLDVHGTADAGIEGARRLFGVTGARIALADGTVFGAVPAGTPVVHALAIGAVAVGDLQLTGLGRLRPRNQRMLDAFGDALAAALHDAITQDELRTMSERTTYDAVHDPLTGLFNRAALLSRGNAVLRRRGPDDPVAMLLLDVNDFKEVNNALGHAAGDEVLRVIAGRVTEAGNAGDLLARLGGDEFALLITDLDTGGADLALAAAVERARKLSAQIAVPMRVDGVLLSKEPSIGVVVAAAGEVDLTELLRRADIAMYQAKRAVQPVAWYDAARDDASTDRLALLAELREALNTDEQLTVELQPAVSLAAGAQQITGVEALIRWKHPRRGRLAPGQFLPVVEASELMAPLTRWVLDRAIGLASSWRRAGLAVPVSVNISARSLLERQLPETIGDLLARHRLPAELLVLEITETVMLSKSPVIDDVLLRIRRLGVQLAVDDFGTGFSSFTVLTRLPVQEVKIDREFVAHMIDSPTAAAIVRATVELGLRLKLRVVAEGVENPDQRAALAALGCTSAQGFLFHPPLAADRLAAVLRERRQVQRRHLRAEGAG
ncbi:bifunctional diguanylate cyclase/phosphodiesterase [Dactylosporangium sp. NBC_01737]|uniref:putative bifunctional diguanylate cyclase/phosphodiesterase n=1 Tax=Dactylosporangium sp. NBC_01737 TaxID=2975959 RepID=UPI002E15F288|nr:bifunctional diguanylate cyclase/phosphodiesterase [Dactylosporangium sp. NBC_01737]